MARVQICSKTALVLSMSFGAVALGLPGTAEAAAPIYYADLMTFQSDITFSVTDDYSDLGYGFIQADAVMSGVIGETDYQSTGFNDLNIVYNAPADPRYCAGCNGSFELSFQTTSVGNAAGVIGVGMFIESHDMGTPYFAFITFADGTTDNIALPAAGNFWGVSAPERIESIHFGLSMGGTTTSGSFGIDDLIVGDGNVGTCMIDADCVPDMDVCTDEVCVDGMCTYPFNNAPCDDDNLCTEMDACDMATGMCTGTPVDCSDENVCTTNLCDPAGGCIIIQFNTEPCDDGSVCTEMDTCDSGVCVGAQMDCSDGDVCSADSCDPVMGCMSEPIEGCCVMDSDCGDEQMCDRSQNLCVDTPVSGSSESGDPTETGGAETGDTGMGSGGAADDTTTSADGGGGDSGGASGVGDSGAIDTDPLGNGDSGGDGGSSSGNASGGSTPLPDAGCGCTTTPPAGGQPWWLMVALGALIRRRRRAA